MLEKKYNTCTCILYVGSIIVCIGEIVPEKALKTTKTSQLNDELHAVEKNNKN